MRVALIVDNPFRDLVGLALVGARLATAGHEAVLVPMMRQDAELRALAPDVVVVNYLRPTNERVVRDLLRAGISVYILETEGGLYSDLGAYNRSLAAEVQLHRSCTRYLSWGTRLGQHCVDAGWYTEDQLVVTGQPRFDLYSRRWRSMALELSPYAAVTDGPMVLICGNFPTSNPRFQTPEKEARMMVEVFGSEPREIACWQQRQNEMMVGLIDVVRRLAKEFPEVTFVYRPHPFENLDTYREPFRDVPGIRLDKIGGVQGWILRAVAVIQRTSTTALEAGMAGVPALSPAWLPSPDPTDVADESSIACPDFESLADAVQSAVRAHAGIT